ncbi:MAG TPA: SRPBCC family protein [Actinomycetota bacterium]|nr:SRPBCC family protein [Actinomycetota bacterium]
MPTYSASVEIAAPREAVFPHVAALDAHPSWSVDPIEIERIDDERYRSNVRAKGKAISAEIHVRERRAPERVVFDVADMTGQWRHTITLTPAENGTRITRTIEGRLSAKQLALYLLVVLPIKKPNNRKSLLKLKERVESS